MERCSYKLRTLLFSFSIMNLLYRIYYKIAIAVENSIAHIRVLIGNPYNTLNYISFYIKSQAIFNHKLPKCTR